MAVSNLEERFHIFKVPKEGADTDSRPIRYLLGGGDEHPLLLQGQSRLNNCKATPLTAKSASVDHVISLCLRHIAPGSSPGYSGIEGANYTITQP
ncbi:hypothetical protein GCM10007052_02780 [Halioglobus japonicus]|nr:hypothetical protein GCM10007052_02780 [Halioglobus japonicus]